MEESKNLKSFEELLNLASGGQADAIKEFLERLLESKVIVLKPLIQDQSEQIAILGQKSGVEHHGFYLFSFEGKEILPMFTAKELIPEWSSEGLETVEKEFKTLLWLLGGETWIHLNPGSAVGKEFSPWEVALLKEGPESIPEIVADLMDAEHEELEVDSGRELFPGFKKQVLPILEIYPQLEEAFFITIRYDEESEPKPMLGIKHSGLSDKQLKQIVEEIIDIARDGLSINEPLMVVHDLADPLSPNGVLFRDVTPFYLATKPLPDSVPTKSQVVKSSVSESSE